MNNNDYDINAIKEYLNKELNEQEDYYGTAMMNGLSFATIDLIDVGKKYDVTGLDDDEVILKAQELGILEDFRKGKRY